jgi:hypothetical protein
MNNGTRQRCVAIYYIRGRETHRVAELVNEEGGPVELRIRTEEFADEARRKFERGFGSEPLARRVTAVDGDAFLDAALENLGRGTYWRAVEEDADR